MRSKLVGGRVTLESSTDISKLEDKRMGVKITHHWNQVPIYHFVVHGYELTQGTTSQDLTSKFRA